jgi:purine-nucleoside phosphorylase
VTFNPKSAAAWLRKNTRLRPSLAIVLGSGFQSALSRMEMAGEFRYAEVPGMPSVGVSGHAGKLILGHFGRTPVLALKGRAHYYEGNAMERVTFGIRVLAQFGIRTVLLTNAAGGINRRFRPGDLMILEDHINFMGVNPLRGMAVAGLPRFVDCTAVYHPELRQLVKTAARKCRLRTHSGVYLAVAGPSYETPAEIRMFGKLGADAVGMSTVPEALVARQCGLAVAGVSCITNLAAGQCATELRHAEVLAVVDQKRGELASFLETFAQLYGEK